MSDQYWNYIVTFVGLIGFYLGGKKIWWAWYVNIANQVLWLTFGLVTQQWGFVVGTFFYTPVFVRNAYLWTKEHREDARYDRFRKKNSTAALSVGFKLDADSFYESVRVTEAALTGMQNRTWGPKRWRWLPLWLRKRIFPKPVTYGLGGPVIGKIESIENTGEGLFVTSTIDRSTPEGKAAWEKIRGPLPPVSLPEDEPDRNDADC